jgi:hypothetical protein
VKIPGQNNVKKGIYLIKEEITVMPYMLLSQWLLGKLKLVSFHINPCPVQERYSRGYQEQYIGFA